MFPTIRSLDELVNFVARYTSAGVIDFRGGDGCPDALRDVPRFLYRN